MEQHATLQFIEKLKYMPVFKNPILDTKAWNCPGFDSANDIFIFMSISLIGFNPH